MRVRLDPVTCMQEQVSGTASSIRLAVACGGTVSLTILAAPPNEAVTLLERFCAMLVAQGVKPSSSITCVLHGSCMPLRSFVLVTRCFLGDGPRYVICDERTDWRYLWRHRMGRWSVWPAYANFVTTTCGLLDDELADAIVPPTGIQAPVASAWLLQHIDLVDYADAEGRVCRHRLGARLDEFVMQSATAPPAIAWPHNTMCEDAWLNRRLAVHVTGIGELPARSNRSPADRATQNDLLDLVQFVRDELAAANERAANGHELLPALERTNPVRGLQGGVCSGEWLSAWQQAVARNLAKHRNLLVLSPYSVLPHRSQATPAAADILPMLNFSDACWFADPPSFEGWKFNDFKDFHRRARAEIRRRESPPIVAARV